MAAEISVNYPRIARLARDLEHAIELPARGVPATELFMAGVIFAMKIAHEAQPHATVDEIADLMTSVAGNLLLEYRERRLPIKFLQREELTDGEAQTRTKGSNSRGQSKLVNGERPRSSHAKHRRRNSSGNNSQRK